MTVKAYAKINLFLDITGILPNGFHSLENITQSVDMHDIISVETENSDRTVITVSCSDDTVPTDERNTAYKAAALYLDLIGKTAKVDISITKNIPVMGGMGGSSVDAAGVFYALDRLFNAALDKNALFDAAKKIGADVPICLKGGTVCTRGKNADMFSLDAYTDYTIVCVKPDLSFNTAEAYALFDRTPILSDNEADSFISELSGKASLAFSKHIYNIFTPLYSDGRIDALKKALIGYGASGAEMTGSGSVVYGIFENKDIAEKAAEKLGKAAELKVFVTKPHTYGVEIV